MTANLVPIGAAARQFGIAPSCLRYYEEIKLLLPATRHGGRRYYDQTGLERLAFIRLLQDCGFSLDEIARILGGTGARWRSIVKDHIAALQVGIDMALKTKAYLEYALHCPRDNPLHGCPVLHRDLEEQKRKRARGPSACHGSGLSVL